jgi:HAE1 family hydrophobic/amphiphilic exporter-1
MTSFAFILGVVPLLGAYGAGAEARKVMGMAVFAGMITATVIGVILIPSFFVLIERQKKSKRKAATVAQAPHSTDEQNQQPHA